MRYISIYKERRYHGFKADPWRCKCNRICPSGLWDNKVGAKKWVDGERIARYSSVCCNKDTTQNCPVDSNSLSQYATYFVPTTNLKLSDRFGVFSELNRWCM